MTAGADRILVCRECGSEFVFTAGEQEFYSERGFVPPSRCPSCRAARRAERQSSPSDGYSGGSAYGTGMQRGSVPRPMFPAICDDCGRETMVPFEPRPDRPVYCRDCFARRRQQYSY